jgi:hypothetical protein
VLRGAFVSRRGSGIRWPLMDAAPRRDRTLALWVLLTVLLAAVVTPLAVEVSRPAVHDWDTTVGFVAGVGAACVGIRGVLRRLGRP